MSRILGLLALLALFAAPVHADDLKLLNVSYDPTRELYQEINTAFAKDWLTSHHQTVTIQQSHGGSGKQARSVIDGLAADVVTLGLAGDIDAIADKAQLLPANWQDRLLNRSTPYTSTIVFLVRKGNPKAVRDWADLARPGVQVVTSNPKTSAGGRWAYIAAWGWALKAFNGDEAKAKAYLVQLFRNVPVLDAGARATTITFAQRNIGDVMIAWENEAILAMDELQKGKFELVYPPYTVQAEPPVALVDKNVDKHGTRAVALAYLQFLYTPQAQAIVAKHHYRPRDAQVAAQHKANFPAVTTWTIDKLGGWRAVQAKHLADGALFDQIQAAAKP